MCRTVAYSWGLSRPMDLFARRYLLGMSTLSAEPEVLTFHQFAWKYNFDIEISHDRLRFPNGISKIQAKRNKEAAQFHFGEALRAMVAYNKACEEGTVRPPNAAEAQMTRMYAHPDHESTRATWRVIVKHAIRRDSSLTEQRAAEQIIEERMNGMDPWVETLGLPVTATVSEIAARRVQWMHTEGPYFPPTVADETPTLEITESRSEQLALF